MGKSQEEITLMLLNTLKRIYFGKSARELAEFLQGGNESSQLYLQQM